MGKRKPFNCDCLFASTSSSCRRRYLGLDCRRMASEFMLQAAGWIDSHQRDLSGSASLSGKGGREELSSALRFGEMET